MRLHTRTVAWAAAVLLSIIILSVPALIFGGRNRSVPGTRTEQQNARQSEKARSAYSGKRMDRVPSAAPSLSEALAEADPDRRIYLLRCWAQSLDVKEMGKVLESIQGMKISGPIKAQACGAVLSCWAERDRAGAVTWFCKRPAADSLHQQARDLLAEEMASRNPAASLSWMEKSVLSSGRSELYGPFFREWMKINPAAATSSIQQMAGSATNEEQSAKWSDLAGQVAAQWGDTDLYSATAWVQSLPKGSARACALEQISFKWTEADPKSAAAYAMAENNPKFIGNVITKWASGDLKAAAEWVNNLPPDANGAAAESLATVWAERDMAGAATYVANLPAGEGQDKAAVAVVTEWAETAPARAAEWVKAFEECPVRSLAMQQLMEAWTKRDAAQAAQWLQGEADTPSRDSAVNTFSSVLSQSNPEAAFQWAGSISNTIMRVQQLQNVARTWLKADPNGAQRAIKASDLPENIKSGLLPASPDTNQ